MLVDWWREGAELRSPGLWGQTPCVPCVYVGWIETCFVTCSGTVSFFLLSLLPEASTSLVLEWKTGIWHHGMQSLVQFIISMMLSDLVRSRCCVAMMVNCCQCLIMIFVLRGVPAWCDRHQCALLTYWRVVFWWTLDDGILLKALNSLSRKNCPQRHCIANVQTFLLQDILDDFLPCKALLTTKHSSARAMWTEKVT